MQFTGEDIHMVVRQNSRSEPQRKGYIFELSGEHEALPRAEVLACLEAQDAEYGVESEDKGILVIKGENIDTLRLRKRLALTHGIDLEYLTCQVTKLAGLEHELDIGKGTFSVRAKRIQSQHEELNLKALEKGIADLVKGGNQVDLENPDIEIRVIISGRCYIGKVPQLDEVVRKPKKADVSPCSFSEGRVFLWT